MQNYIKTIFKEILNIDNIKVLSIPEDDIEYGIFVLNQHTEKLSDDELKKYCPTYAIARVDGKEWIGLIENYYGGTHYEPLSSDLLEIKQTISKLKTDCLRKLIHEIVITEIDRKILDILMYWDVVDDREYKHE